MIRKAVIVVLTLGAVLLVVMWVDSILRGPLEIAGIERDRRKRIGLDLSRRAIQLGDAITVELDKPIVLHQRFRRPCHRAGKRTLHDRDHRLVLPALFLDW